MLRAILLVFGLLVFSHARNVVHNFNPGSRIVNGQDASEGEIPFQVSLQSAFGHFCGGSIVNEQYVVTAGHCVSGDSASGIKIIAGTIDRNKPHMKRQAIKLIVHEGYNPSDSYINDVALIKVDPPFVFSELVQPVALPELHSKIRVNATAVVSGWGRLGGSTNTSPNILQKAQIWVADQDYCKKIMKKQNMDIHPTHICANDPNTRRGQCNGDSGGPLTVDGKLTGIVSWSIKDPYCASTEYPGVYTRVPEYVDWILEHAV